ncbi:coniferyl alcohol acyltransferase-like [Typha angustifolia]|uniref:coniferyl alcohol acyltransferase-like n=1 Tax=Typha angustifolia TaxID=59011 RepID=UPI003C2AC046
MAIPDLQLRVTSRTLIKASNPPPQPSILPVSNLDLVFHSFHISLFTIYPSPGNGDSAFSSIVSTVKSTLPAFLNYFFPFSGRIQTDPATNVPEINNNNAGAELVVAESGLPLSAIHFHDVDKSLNLIQLPFAKDLALSLQLVRFSCGGFSISWGTNHLLVDGHGLTMLPSSWSEFVRSGKLSSPPNHDRSVFRPRSPPRYDSKLEQEFMRYDPSKLINVLMADAVVRRNYVVDACDVDRLRELASSAGHRATRTEAMSAYLWKTMGSVIGESDSTCRMAWPVEGRRRLGGEVNAAMEGYLGNVVTYASKEITVQELAQLPLSAIAKMVRTAIKQVASKERFLQLVDWMEENKKYGKWTEVVGVGFGSPAMVVTSLGSFEVDADFGFGKPGLVMPWVRPGRLGTASMTLLRSSKGDGSWIAGGRLWPKLAAAIEADPGRVFKKATAENLGLTAPTQVSRL